MQFEIVQSPHLVFVSAACNARKEKGLKAGLKKKNLLGAFGGSSLYHPNGSMNNKINHLHYVFKSVQEPRALNLERHRPTVRQTCVFNALLNATSSVIPADDADKTFCFNLSWKKKKNFNHLKTKEKQKWKSVCWQHMYFSNYLGVTEQSCKLFKQLRILWAHSVALLLQHQ